MPDGSTVPWDYDTVRKIAMILTVDKNGKDATEAGFDPENIVQWGFEPQRDDLRQVGAYWKAGTFMAADGKTVQIPEAWAAAWHWFYDGIWTDHISVDRARSSSNTDFNPDGYPFFTGKVAMSENYLWSTYGVADAGDDWNIAATPSYQGQTTAAFNADTFRILKDTKHPDEAFKVLQYLLGEAEELLKLYAGMPAVEAKQDAFLQTPPGRLHADHRLECGQEGRRLRRRPELRVVHARLQPDPRPAQHVRDEVAVDAGARPRRRDRRPEDADAGHLGQGRQLIDGGPQRRALARPAPPVGARLAARTLGLRLHRAVAHRVRRCSRRSR